MPPVQRRRRSTSSSAIRCRRHSPASARARSRRTGATGVVDTTSGTTLGATIARLDAGRQRHDRIRRDARPDRSRSRRSPTPPTPTWTSLPGTNGSAADGVATPGAPGTATGERTGSGGVNDYAASASARRCRSAAPTSPRAIVGRKPRYAIGDSVTYQVDVAVPGSAFGSIGNVVDHRHPRRRASTYVPGSLVITYNGVTSSTSPADFTRHRQRARRRDSETLTLALGTVDQYAARRAATLTLTYQAIVANVLSNQANTSLGNSATITFSDPGTGGASATRGPATTSITVGEPFLALTKTLTSPPVGLAGRRHGELHGRRRQHRHDDCVRDRHQPTRCPPGLFFPGGTVVTVTPNNLSGQLQVPTVTVDGSGLADVPRSTCRWATASRSRSRRRSRTACSRDRRCRTAYRRRIRSRNGSRSERARWQLARLRPDRRLALDNYNVAALAATITVADPIAIDKTFYRRIRRSTAIRDRRAGHLPSQGFGARGHDQLGQGHRRAAGRPDLRQQRQRRHAVGCADHVQLRRQPEPGWADADVRPRRCRRSAERRILATTSSRSTSSRASTTSRRTRTARCSATTLR